MDIMLGDDREGFDLVLEDNFDLQLATTHGDRLINCMKIALFTQFGWMSHSELGTRLEFLLRLPVSMVHRLQIQKEIERSLYFLLVENLIRSIDIDVVIVDNKKYELRIFIDDVAFHSARSWLEVRE